jgi:hypothetical protein
MTTEAEIDPAYRAALARHEERRNRYVSYSEVEELRAKLDGVELPRVGMYAPDFRAPETAPEYWDDQIIRFGNFLNRGWPEHRFVAGLAAAARDGGAAAAVKLVKDARHLEQDQQAAAFQNVRAMEDGTGAKLADVQRVVKAVLGEWEKLDLAQLAGDAEAGRKRARKGSVTV